MPYLARQSKLLATLLLLVMTASGCSSRRSIVAEELETKVAVWIIPLDDFSYEEAERLAKALSDDLKLRVRATLNMGSAGLLPFPGTVQFPAEDIFAAAERVIANLPEKQPDSAFVVLTRRDINSKVQSLRFTFSMQNRTTRTAVISIARMLPSQSGGMADATTIRRRLFKMAKRNIGDIYFGYPRSTDIQDIMYSPIMSLDDLDRIGTGYGGKPMTR